MARYCLYTNDSFYDRTTDEYVLALIKENDAGYTIYSKHVDLGLLQQVADSYNTQRGHNRDDVMHIVASSMIQGKVRS